MPYKGRLREQDAPMLIIAIGSEPGRGEDVSELTY